MKTIYVDGGTPVNTTACVATIGFFDGVHRGHRFLISQVCEQAKAEGREAMVITFDRHPRQVLQDDYQPALLTTTDEKLQLLEETGIDTVAVLHFDRVMASLSARDFMEQVLLGRLNVRTLVTGYDNRFGRGRTENFNDYVRYGQELGIRVVQSEAFMLGREHVSSSLVRSALRRGDVAHAARCLGRPYVLAGRVVSGHQEGRKLGFPTANVDASASACLVPANGVYAVKAGIVNNGCKEASQTVFEGMMNIGMRPTFNGHERTLEVNLFNFDGNLYGRELSVAFIRHIREEQHFDSADMLAAQLRRDEAEIKKLFEQDKANE